MNEDMATSLRRALAGLGVMPTDIVMLHSNVSQLLKMPLGDGKLNFLLETLLSTVPDGTLVVPTFTYKFCSTGKFDPAQTPSEVGLFTEVVRKDKRAIRSTHPIFSVVAIGRHAESLCRNLSRSSYGPGSIFERLYVSDAKLLHFDVALADSCTFAHYPEQHIGVPYRYSKYFAGTSASESAAAAGEWEFYVRALEYLEFKPQPAEEMRYAKDLENKGISKKAAWEKVTLILTPCRGIFDVITTGLKSDPYYMLNGVPEHKAVIG